MASDYLDYENNLAFPPQEIKSQDDIKHQDTRSSDVLIKALEKCEKLEEENQQLKELIKECREFFYENLIDTEFHFSCGLGSDIKKQSCIRSLSKLKTKIDNAIGEKK